MNGPTSPPILITNGSLTTISLFLPRRRLLGRLWQRSRNFRRDRNQLLSRLNRPMMPLQMPQLSGIEGYLMSSEEEKQPAVMREQSCIAASFNEWRRRPQSSVADLSNSRESRQVARSFSAYERSGRVTADSEATTSLLTSTRQPARYPSCPPGGVLLRSICSSHRGREAVTPHDLNHSRLIRWTARRRSQYFGTLAEKLGTDGRWRDHA